MRMKYSKGLSLSLVLQILMCVFWWSTYQSAFSIIFLGTAGTWKQSTEGMLIASISMSCGIDSLMSMAVLALNKPGILVLSGAGEGVVTHADTR